MQVARDMLSRLMRGAVWLNLHQLPPFDAPRFVLEMRNEQVCGRNCVGGRERRVGGREASY